MVLIFRDPLTAWRERLARLDARRDADALEPWRPAMERRLLSYLLKRYAGGDPPELPRAAQELDEEAARSAAQIYLSAEARLRLDPATSARARRAYLSPEEQARFEAYELRRQEYLARLKKRESVLLWVFFTILFLALAWYFVLLAF